MTAIILCADDYALAPGVSRAIRELAEMGRLNATSVMTTSPELAAEAAALRAMRPLGFQVGLHVTLTGGLPPATDAFGATFPALPALMAKAFGRAITNAQAEREIEAQFHRFRNAFGAPPDFVDGHQHVHLLPVIRAAVIRLARKHAPKAWLRQCTGPRGAGLGPKAHVIASLSAGLKRDAARVGMAVCPAFSGAYDFAKARDFATIFPGFLADLPPGAVVMVHPGHVDETLRKRDPVHEPRAQEFAFLAGPDFERALGPYRLA